MNHPEQKNGEINASMSSFTKKRKPAPSVIVLFFLFLFLSIFVSSFQFSTKQTAALQVTATAEYQRGYRDGEATVIAEDTATAVACATSTVTPTRRATGIVSCSTTTPTP